MKLIPCCISKVRSIHELGRQGVQFATFPETMQTTA